MDTLNDRLTRAAVLYVTPDRTPTVKATSSDGDWPDTTRLEVLTDPVLSIAPSSLAGDLAVWTLTDEQATAVRAAQSVRVTVDASLPVIAATVVDTTGWRGLPGADDEPWSVVVGPAGKSAYASAVQHGYVGTEQEWLASLGGIHAMIDPDNPDCLLITFPSYALAEDGHSILIPVEA